MNSITFLIIIGIIIWTLQALFGFFQMKNFKKNFVEMRKEGRVVIGFNKGFIFSGTVVLIRINDETVIEEVRYMQGVTIFARFKNLKGLKGKKLLSLEKRDLKDFNKLLIKAIFKAVENYKKHGGGEEREEKIQTEHLKLKQLTE
jgi:DNA-binding transcriptional regulator of glucitol operon